MTQKRAEGSRGSYCRRRDVECVERGCFGCHRGGPAASLPINFQRTKARRKDKDASSSGGGQEEPKMYLESTVLECTIPESRLRDLVELPQGLDYNEWLASHTLAFFDHINLLYGTVSEFCTMSGCPDMTGPGNRQYLWFDEKGKKCKVAAPQYIDYVMTFTQKTVNDESLFPTKFGECEISLSVFLHSFPVFSSLLHGMLH
ncbi:hypothetical protein HPB48_025701 [Haemaphysalis longicornis]|uniref:MOB kinase activator-like 2 n=1 Tax=Haemaphysalis longicornis TaxID=44386 RepID=A0A9J6H844_HAELO|nr:hypothetical protein HPB48_025701 [Haemaphysalis longicornis]